MPEPTALMPDLPESDEAKASAPDSSAEELLLEEDLVIEDVSIDGMCGVY